jgi:hypothetical protein
MPVDVKEHCVRASSSDAGQTGAKALATLLRAEALAGAPPAEIGQGGLASQMAGEEEESSERRQGGLDGRAVWLGRKAAALLSAPAEQVASAISRHVDNIHSFLNGEAIYGHTGSPGGCPRNLSSPSSNAQASLLRRKSHIERNQRLLCG